MRLVIDHGDETMGERGDVAGATGTRQAHDSVLAMHLCGVQVPETVYLCRSEETEIDAARLQQAHYAHHVETLGGMQQVGWIGHGVDQLRRRTGANDSVLEQSHAVWSMSLLGHYKCNQRQPHAHKHNLAVADFARGRCDHHLAKGIAHFAVKTAARFSR